jgi:murein DD-endopeptidase MepM/ murein hydrolase activator NlpD
VVRKSAFALLAALSLAGCAASGATYPAPIHSPQASRPPPAGPSIYETAPRAPLHSQLLACNGGGGSNVGEIGYRGESLLYTPYIDTPAGPLLRNPTEGACLSSGYGWRGGFDSGRQHNGLDLANRNGGFIYAAADGRIRFADYRGGYGNVVEIDHGAGVRTLYAHLSEFDQRLRPGDYVSAGAPIARMGMTGNATGVHLHYEVWVDGLLVDPLHYGRPPVYVSAPISQPLPQPPRPTFVEDARMSPAEPERYVTTPTMSTAASAQDAAVATDADVAPDYPPPVMLQPPAEGDDPAY